jgi:hypothetical protein
MRRDEFGRPATTIFAPRSADDFECVNAIDAGDYEVFFGLDGRPRAATWRPIEVRRVPADDRHGCEPSDFPWLGSHALIMRRGAVDALRDILEASGEVLPLSTRDDVELFVLNVQCVDALDESKSSVLQFPGTDRIMRLETVAFVGARLEGVDLFRLPHRASSTYVSARFVERVRTAGLRGLVFDEVWRG